MHSHINDLKRRQKMGWRRSYFNQWSGNGPFSYLPPWQRPGRAFGGRGYGRWWNGDPRICAAFPWLTRWWWANPKYPYQYPILEPTQQSELAALKERKKALDEDKASIAQEINELELQLRALKAKLEAEKK